MTKLVVLRGNSGSGKTTTARQLQRVLGPTALLISQDVVRRKILHAPDTVGTPAIAVMAELVAWGRARGFAVIILEGILKRSVYGEFLRDLKQAWGPAIIGYFDVTFATTVKRNQTKARSFIGHS
ncbi:AAA family ATPase [Levilactobacillus lanxiensis]|uniref:AAA family ATPase n=1 Tax=Levilactobacillus lanxiensis TaxID=2799568 RepID=A0ABW4CXT7_9LACO